MYAHRARTAGRLGLSDYALRLGCAGAAAFTLTGALADNPPLVATADDAFPAIEVRTPTVPVGGTAILDQAVENVRAFPSAEYAELVR